MNPAVLSVLALLLVVAASFGTSVNVGVLAIALSYHVRGARKDMAPFYALLPFEWFICWNPILWPYFHHPVAGMAAVAVAAGSLHGRQEARRGRRTEKLVPSSADDAT